MYIKVTKKQKMPGKRKFASSYGRRTRGRMARRRPFRMAVTRFRRRRRQIIPRFITPDRKLVKLRYCMELSLNPSSGYTAWVPIAANDITQPALGSVGNHMPMGTDEMFQLYQRGCVIGSKIHVAAADSGDSSVAQGILGVALRNSITPESVQDVTGSPSNEGLLERNRTHWKYIAPNRSGGGVIPSVRHKFSSKKFFQLSSINDNAGNGSGSLWFQGGPAGTTSPSTIAYFNVFLGPMDSNANIACKARITVDYICLFAGRRLLGQS